MPRTIIGLALLSGLASAAVGAPPPAEKTGLKVGERAPDFTPEDQAGKERSLKDLLKDGPVAPVFYRSAGWRPFCQKQRAQLQNDRKATGAAGVRVVGISYDSVDELRAFSDTQKITFPLLSDPDSQVIGAYLLRNKELAGKQFGKVKMDGVPYPGTMVVGRGGVIRAKLFVDGYRERHPTADLVRAAEALEK